MPFLDAILRLSRSSRLQADHCEFSKLSLLIDLSLFHFHSLLHTGASEQHQLRLISELCGALTPDQWPGIERLELYNKLQPQLYGNSGPANRPRRKVRERLGAYVKDHLALDLLDKLLTVDPSKRIDAHNALDHNFFWSPPSPTNFSQTLSLHRSSMFEYLLQPKRRADPMPKQWPNLVPGCSRSNKPNAGDGQYHDRVF